MDSTQQQGTDFSDPLLCQWSREYTDGGDQATNSVKKQKPHIGLRVIELWCWMWMAVWLAAAASTAFGYFAFPLMAGGDMLMFAALAVAMSGTEHGMVLFVSSVCLGQFVLFLWLGVGVRGRRPWARETIMALLFLSITNAIKTILHVFTSDIDLTIPAFHLFVLVLSFVIIHFLNKQEVDEAFGPHEEHVGDIGISPNPLGLNRLDRGSDKS